MSKYSLSFDIGGSYIKFALIETNGQITRFSRIETPDCYQDFLAILSSTTNLLNSNVHGVSVAVPGGYDFAEGKVFAPNFTVINDKNLKKDLEAIFGSNLVIENDANLAAWGEYVFIEKKQIDSMIFVTLGTGVGGGCIINSKLLNGRRTLFEIGHISLDMKGRACGCGRRGCLDEYCSVIGLKTIYDELGGLAPFTPENLGSMARGGDKIAVETFRRYGALLAEALVNVANLLAPEKIKIGGGLSELSDQFTPYCYDAFEKNVFPLYKNSIKIETAELKNNAGLLGGAALVFRL